MSWLPKNKVLVPVDFSDVSLKAVEEALQMVADPSDIHLIHVMPMLAPAEPGVIWNAIDDESREKHVREALAERLTDDKFAAVNIEVAIGDPGHEIAEYAKETGVDLIVLPSHARTGISRLLVGSVAERVVRLAHCPVLVLRE